MSQENNTTPSQDFTVPDAEKLIIAFNCTYFSESLVTIIDILLKTVDENNKSKNLLKFVDVCNRIKTGFSDEESETVSVGDRGRIIKKFYTVVTQHLDLFYPERSLKLFSLLNEKSQAITLIPGLDIELVINKLSTEDLDKFWDQLWLMYLHATVMISTKNKHKKDNKAAKCLLKIKEDLIKSGRLSDEYISKRLLNPFVGVGVNDENYSVNSLYDGTDGINSDISLNSLLKTMNVEKMLGIDDLETELSNIKESDIDDATKQFSTLLGTKGDKEADEPVAMLVREIVSELKANPKIGLSDIGQLSDNINKRIIGKANPKNLEKTAKYVTNFVNSGPEKLKDLKDDKGNAIGDDIMKKLAGPLNMLKSMGLNMGKK